MPLRNVPITYTLDQQRQEINNLAVDFNTLDVGFDEKVDDRLSNLIIAGTGISATYDDSANTLTFALDFTEFDSADIPEGATGGYYHTDAKVNALIDNRVNQAFVNNLAIDVLGNPTTINMKVGNSTKAITGSNYNNAEWDTAYSWGNHAAQGYLTSLSESDTLDTVTGRGGTTTNDIGVGSISTNTFNAVVPGQDNIQFTAVKTDFNSHVIVGGYVNALANDYGIFLDKVGKIVLNNDGTGNAFNVKNSGTDVFTHANDGTINGFLKLPVADGTVNQFLKTDGNGQLGWTTQDSASVNVGDNPPGSASQGDLWWESDKGRLKVYYDNGANPGTWIDASPPLQAPTPGSAVRDAAGNITANNNAVFADTNGDFNVSLTTSSYSKIMVSLNFGYLSGTASTSGSIILQRVVSGTATDIFTAYCPEPSNSNGPFSFQYIDTHGQVPNTVIQYRLKLDLGGAGNRSTGTTYSSQFNLHEI